MLAKAASLTPDALVPDMEDSVPDAEKPAARAMIAQWLPRLLAHKARLIPRVNALRTPWFEEDIAAVAVAGVFGISIGKVDTPDDIEAIDRALDAAEAHRLMEAGGHFGKIVLNVSG